MAIDFDGTQRLENVGLTFTKPFSVSCWFDTDNITGTTTVLSQGDVSTSSNFESMLVRGSVANDPLSVNSNGSGEALVTGINSTAYQHGLGIWAAVNDRRCYLDGTKATNNTNLAITGEDRFYIAELVRSTSGLNFNGRIAEVAVWNRALTDAEDAILAAGFSPLFIPNGLTNYWRLLNNGDLIDLVGGANLTAVNAPASAAHPRIIYPSAPIIGIPVAAAGGAITGTSTISLAGSGTLTGSGALSGATAISLAPTGALTGFGALAGAAALSLTPSGTLVGTGALSGSSALSISLSGTLSGKGELIAATTISFTLTGTLTGTGGGAITGNATLSLTPSGTLTGAGALIGSVAIDLTLSGTLINAAAAAPASRTCVVPAQDRTKTIEAQSRTIAVPAQNRTPTA